MKELFDKDGIEKISVGDTILLPNGNTLDVTHPTGRVKGEHWLGKVTAASKFTEWTMKSSEVVLLAGREREANKEGTGRYLVCVLFVMPDACIDGRSNFGPSPLTNITPVKE